MIVLGIDASYSRTGMVWVDEKGILDYVALYFPPQPQRLKAVAIKLRRELALRPKVDVCVMERASGLAGPVLNQLQGVFILVLQAWGVEFDPKRHLVAPQTWKKWLCNNGRADKQHVKDSLRLIFDITFEKDPGNDLADAAGIALWGREHRRG